MADNELAQYIRNQLNAGYQQEDVVQALVQSGYNAAIASRTVYDVAHQTHPNEQQFFETQEAHIAQDEEVLYEADEKQNEENPLWVWAAIIGAGIVIVITFVVLPLMRKAAEG